MVLTDIRLAAKAIRSAFQRAIGEAFREDFEGGCPKDPPLLNLGMIRAIEARGNHPPSCESPSCADEIVPTSELESDQNDKENSRTPGPSTAKSMAGSRSYGNHRVHFRPAHDILLLKAVRAEQAHLRGLNGSLSHKWSMVQRDVTSVVRDQLKSPEWSACARTLQERFKKLLMDCREGKLNEV